VIIFRLRTTPKTSLQKIINTANLSTGQDGGFFTTISSNATKAGTAVVWALSRPTDNNPANVLLYAFDPTTGAQLTSLVAGTWPNTSGDADLVPVVANGRIYVASYKQLTIFALGQPAHAVAVAAPRPPAAHAMAGAPHSLTGMVMGVNGARMMLRLRSGQIVAVDLDPARRAYAVAVPVEGQAARVRGDWSGDLFRARVVLHAKQAAALWVEDQ
jgi:outer membrane protein assembly factor BamB